ncbi:preprotein translocase subunit SecG [Mesorhizobium sp. A556]
METILIVIHLIVVIALVGVVLLQKSEGGGLDIGGGSGFMTARGAANTLTRATAILGTIFFVTSLSLTLLARYGEKATDILDRVPAPITQQNGNGVLDQLPGATTPAKPADTAPTPPSDNEAAAPATQPAPATSAPATPAPASNGTTEPAAPQVPN